MHHTSQRTRTFNKSRHVQALQTFYVTHPKHHARVVVVLVMVIALGVSQPKGRCVVQAPQNQIHRCADKKGKSGISCGDRVYLILYTLEPTLAHAFQAPNSSSSSSLNRAGAAKTGSKTGERKVCLINTCEPGEIVSIALLSDHIYELAAIVLIFLTSPSLFSSCPPLCCTLYFHAAIKSVVLLTETDRTAHRSPLIQPLIRAVHTT